MPQPKAPPENWVQEANALSELLSVIPSIPYGLLSLTQVAEPLLPPYVERLERLRDALGRLLTYRSSVTHKFKVPQADKAWPPAAFIDDEILRMLSLMQRAGVELTSVDYTAMRARRMICSILQDRFACDAWKRELPLLVGSLSEVRRPVQPPTRMRPIELRAETLRLLAAQPSASYKDLLRQLEGQGIVTQWDDNNIEWTELEPPYRSRKTATGTFRNWLVEAKRGTNHG